MKRSIPRTLALITGGVIIGLAGGRAVPLVTAPGPEASAALAQVIQPQLMTEAERLHRLIGELAALGEMLPAQDPNQQRSERRDLYRQVLCMLATFLQLNGDPYVAPAVLEACEVQWQWWPDQAQFCTPCAN